MTTVSSGQLAWLEGELQAWQADGLIDDDASRAIRSRYVAARRFSLARLLLALGATFVAAGLIWLVAANLDRLSPLLRFGAVTALWLGLVIAAEVLADRRARSGEQASPVVGAVRILVTAAFGAVIFQAAQSLQVPAYGAGLVGWWGLGALLYAYAVGGIGPLLVGVGTTTVWFTWLAASTADGMLGFVGAVLLGAVVATAIGVLHASRWLPRFATSWRVVGALLVLGGMFAAALPRFGADRSGWSIVLTTGAVAAAVLVGAALVLGAAPDRLEAAVPVLALALGVVLVQWAPDTSVTEPNAQVTSRAVISVLVYLAVAGWYAVLGVRRDLSALTGLATAALVLFTTVQSFAVFAPIISGATLFLAVGLVLLASGYGFDRARRRLVASVEEES
jgi:uncharacterized membrane protein